MSLQIASKDIDKFTKLSLFHLHRNLSNRKQLFRILHDTFPLLSSSSSGSRYEGDTDFLFKFTNLSSNELSIKLIKFT